MRRLRTEQGVEAAKTVAFVLVAPQDMRKLIEENRAAIEVLVRVSSLTFVQAIADGWVTAVSGNATVGLDLAGTIDVAKELAKMTKEIEELETYIASLGAKMKNQEFLEKAPTKVKEEMERKYGEAEAKLVALKERQASLGRD